MGWDASCVHELIRPCGVWRELGVLQGAWAKLRCWAGARCVPSANKAANCTRLTGDRCPHHPHSTYIARSRSGVPRICNQAGPRLGGRLFAGQLPFFMHISLRTILPAAFVRTQPLSQAQLSRPRLDTPQVARPRENRDACRGAHVRLMYNDHTQNPSAR